MQLRAIAAATLLLAATSSFAATTAADLDARLESLRELLTETFE